MLWLTVASLLTTSLVCRWAALRGEHATAARNAADAMADGLAPRASFDELDHAEQVARAWRQARSGSLVRSR